MSLQNNQFSTSGSGNSIQYIEIFGNSTGCARSCNLNFPCYQRRKFPLSVTVYSSTHQFRFMPDAVARHFLCHLDDSHAHVTSDTEGDDETNTAKDGDRVPLRAVTTSTPTKAFFHGVERGPFDLALLYLFVEFIVFHKVFLVLRFGHQTAREIREAFKHDDVIKWKQFRRYWPSVQGIHRSPVNYPHKGQWCGALMFSLSAPE